MQTLSIATNQNLSLEIAKQPKSPEARGLELMMQRDDLIYQGAQAQGPEERAEAIARLDAWHAERTEADWMAIKAAEYGSGKAGRLRLVQVLEDVSPIGQRR